MPHKRLVETIFARIEQTSAAVNWTTSTQYTIQLPIIQDAAFDCIRIKNVTVAVAHAGTDLVGHAIISSNFTSGKTANVITNSASSANVRATNNQVLCMVPINTDAADSVSQFYIDTKVKCSGVISGQIILYVDTLPISGTNFQGYIDIALECYRYV